MTPDVDFTLPDGGFECHEKLLADRGIEVRPMSRETVEDLEKGRISHVTISGILVFDGSDFVYHIHKSAGSCRLTVEAFTREGRDGKALVAAVRSVFPQPERGPISPPVPQRSLDGSKIGCIAILVAVGAILFFATIGIRSVFWR